MKPHRVALLAAFAAGAVVAAVAADFIMFLVALKVATASVAWLFFCILPLAASAGRASAASWSGMAG